MNLGSRLAREKVRIDSVISQPQTPPIRLCADSAKRFQKFEQADILTARAIQNRERVAGDWRIDGDVLFVRREQGRGRRRQKGHAGQQYPVPSTQYPVPRFPMRTGYWVLSTGCFTPAHKS